MPQHTCGVQRRAVELFDFTSPTHAILSACSCSFGGLWFLSLSLTTDVSLQTPLNLGKSSPHFSEWQFNLLSD